MSCSEADRSQTQLLKSHCGGKAVLFKTERKYPGWQAYRAQILDMYADAEMLLGKLKRLSPYFPFTKV